MAIVFIHRKNGETRVERYGDDGAVESLPARPDSGRTHRPGVWPMESDAMGVGIDQVDEAYAESAKHGVPTEFNRKTGAAIFTSKAHRKRYCELYGFYDRNGGYSDPQRN